MVTPVHSVGDRIRDMRKARGWSQESLAQAVGVRGLAVGKWERGQANPTTENRAALAALFGVEPSEMGVDLPGIMGGADAPAWFVEAQSDLHTKLDRILTILESRP